MSLHKDEKKNIFQKDPVHRVPYNILFCSPFPKKVPRFPVNEITFAEDFDPMALNF